MDEIMDLTSANRSSQGVIFLTGEPAAAGHAQSAKMLQDVPH